MRPSLAGFVIGQPPESLQTVLHSFCYSNLEQGLSAGYRYHKTRYSTKSGHGRPEEGFAGTRDKWAKNRDVPVKLGRVATLVTDDSSSKHSVQELWKNRFHSHHQVVRELKGTTIFVACQKNVCPASNVNSVGQNAF